MVVTSQRVIGSATAVDVQLTPSVKVSARVVSADRARDVAVLWIDPGTAASVPPIPLGCASGPRPPFADRQKMVTIGAPLSGPKEISPGDVIRVEPHAVVADFRLSPGSTGGPVFSISGSLVGLSSIVDDPDQTRRRNRDARVVPADDVCEAVRSAEKAMHTATRPDATHLPVVPLQPFPAAALDAAVKRHAGSLNPYQMSSSDFDIAFLTPALVSAQQRNAQQRSAPPANGPRDFGVWSDYFADVPAVLVVRVTPKLAESFWTTGRARRIRKGAWRCGDHICRGLRGCAPTAAMSRSRHPPVTLEQRIFTPTSFAKGSTSSIRRRSGRSARRSSSCCIRRRIRSRRTAGRSIRN